MPSKKTSKDKNVDKNRKQSKGNRKHHHRHRHHHRDKKKPNNESKQKLEQGEGSLGCVGSPECKPSEKLGRSAPRLVTTKGHLVKRSMKTLRTIPVGASLENTTNKESGNNRVTVETKPLDTCDQIQSDVPTVMIAPLDYENIYSKQKQQKMRDNCYQDKPRVTEKANAQIDSDVPTVMIAPLDYENIYSKQKKDLNKMPKETIKEIASDVPTVMIAPLDYENIYCKTKRTGQAIKPVVGKADADNCDVPTVMIAPDDYQNIFTQGKQPTKVNTNTTTTANNNVDAVTKIPSDAPTALIAPLDYENIFSAQKQKKQQIQQSLKANLEAEAGTIDSDTPTALIAPDDYVNIYKAQP